MEQTLEERLVCCEQEYERDVIWDNTKTKILKILPDLKSNTGKGWTINPYKLYDTEVHATIGNSFRGDTIELEDIMSVLHILKPLPMKFYRDGYASIRLRSHIDKNEERATITNINPIKLTFDNPTYAGASVKLSYLTNINGTIVGIEAYLPTHQVGYIHWTRKFSPSLRKEIVDDVSLHTKLTGSHIKEIKWGTGGYPGEYVPTFTKYNLTTRDIARLLLN